MAAAHSDDEDLTAAVEKIADAMGGGGYVRNNGRNRGVEMWQLIVAVLGVLAAVMATAAGILSSVARDRLEIAQRMTEITERQNAVLNSYIPQLRQELIDLRATNSREEDRIMALEREAQKLTIQIGNHERDDERKWRSSRPRTSEPWDK